MSFDSHPVKEREPLGKFVLKDTATQSAYESQPTSLKSDELPSVIRAELDDQRIASRHFDVGFRAEGQGTTQICDNPNSAFLHGVLMLASPCDR